MHSSPRPLTRRFFRRDPVRVANALLGHHLVRRFEGHELRGRIVEVEAYLGVADRAAHSFGGRRTDRNHSMWEDGGTAYVYFVYGMHWCFNVVCETAGSPSACLIRAIEPVSGQPVMRRLRSHNGSKKPVRDTDLCSGPAKLAQALAIDKTFDGLDLATSQVLFLTRGKSIPPDHIETSPRIGVDYALEWANEPLRFTEKDSKYVSRPRRPRLRS